MYDLNIWNGDNSMELLEKKSVALLLENHTKIRSIIPFTLYISFI